MKQHWLVVYGICIHKHGLLHCVLRYKLIKNITKARLKYYKYYDFVRKMWARLLQNAKICD